MANLRQLVAKILADSKKALRCKDIYGPVNKAIEDGEYKTKGKTIDASIRRTLQTNPEFKAVARGLWVLTGENSTSLIIEGDGRAMNEIESESMDLIITDHPWEDPKANKGGSRNYANYNVFKYAQADFDAKARVLKDGAYLCEFLPAESGSNWEYLCEIKQMAKKAGFEYYTSLVWDKGFAANCGRRSGAVEQIIIWSKGKPKRLAEKGKPYMAREQLSFLQEYKVPAQKKNRNHDNEKPVELYKYLIECFTEEKDVCLDQFGGSCNVAEAAVKSNRFAVVYELCSDFVKKAVNRLGAVNVSTIAAAE